MGAVANLLGQRSDVWDVRLRGWLAAAARLAAAPNEDHRHNNGDCKAAMSGKAGEAGLSEGKRACSECAGDVGRRRQTTSARGLRVARVNMVQR